LLLKKYTASVEFNAEVKGCMDAQDAWRRRKRVFTLWRSSGRRLKFCLWGRMVRRISSKWGKVLKVREDATRSGEKCKR